MSPTINNSTTARDDGWSYVCGRILDANRPEEFIAWFDHCKILCRSEGLEDYFDGTLTEADDDAKAARVHNIISRQLNDSTVGIFSRAETVKKGLDALENTCVPSTTIEALKLMMKIDQLWIVDNDVDAYTNRYAFMSQLAAKVFGWTNAYVCLFVLIEAERFYGEWVYEAKTTYKLEELDLDILFTSFKNYIDYSLLVKSKGRPSNDEQVSSSSSKRKKSLSSNSSKKQNKVANSTTDAEYLSMCEAVYGAVRITYILDYMKVKYSTPSMNFDNKSALVVANGEGSIGMAKDVRVKYHYIRECIADGVLKLMYVKSKYNRADMFTKALGKTKSIPAVDRLGVVSR